MVSVIIPVFNRRDLIPRAIDSVLRQTFRAFEIIIVDDGSTDGTGALIADRYASDVRLVAQAHGGVSRARNAGIRAAQYDWLAFLDSDDEWLPQKLQQQMACLQRSNLLICHSNEIWIKNGIRVNQCKHHAKSGGDIFLQALPRCIMSPSSIVIHKQVIEKIGDFDESFPTCEDYELFLRLTLSFPVAYVDERLIIKYGGHADQLSHAHFAMDRYRARALAKLLDQLPDLEPGKRQAVFAMLKQKASIVMAGARKRNNTILIEEMQSAMQRWQPGIEMKSKLEEIVS